MQVVRIGEEENPIVIVDNFIDDTEALMQCYANNKDRYNDNSTYYPGVHVQAPPSYSDFLFVQLATVIKDTFKLPPKYISKIESDFSICNLPESELSVKQTIPHYDAVGNTVLAAILYLCDEPFGGTAFYRHKSTGIERATRFNVEELGEHIVAELKATPKPYKYPNINSDYEKIFEVKPKFNRLAIYRGNVLHSGIVTPHCFAPETYGERLTVRTFIRF